MHCYSMPRCERCYGMLCCGATSCSNETSAVHSGVADKIVNQITCTSCDAVYTSSHKVRPIKCGSSTCT